MGVLGIEPGFSARTRALKLLSHLQPLKLLLVRYLVKATRKVMNTDIKQMNKPQSDLHFICWPEPGLQVLSWKEIQAPLQWDVNSFINSGLTLDLFH